MFEMQKELAKFNTMTRKGHYKENNIYFRHNTASNTNQYYNTLKASCCEITVGTKFRGFVMSFSSGHNFMDFVFHGY